MGVIHTIYNTCTAYLFVLQFLPPLLPILGRVLKHGLGHRQRKGSIVIIWDKSQNQENHFCSNFSTHNISMKPVSQPDSPSLARATAHR